MIIGTKQQGKAGFVAPAVSAGQKRKAPPTPERDNRRMAAAVASLESYSDVEILEEIAEDAEDEAEREFNSPPHVPPPSPVMSKREKDGQKGCWSNKTRCVIINFLKIKIFFVALQN